MTKPGIRYIAIQSTGDRKGRAAIRLASTVALAFAVLIAASCTLVDNPHFCDAHADCADPARSYCDVEGLLEGVRNRCVPEPEGETGVCGSDGPCVVDDVVGPAQVILTDNARQQPEPSGVNEDIDEEMPPQGSGRDIGADE